MNDFEATLGEGLLSLFERNGDEFTDSVVEQINCGEFSYSESTHESTVMYVYGYVDALIGKSFDIGYNLVDIAGFAKQLKDAGGMDE